MQKQSLAIVNQITIILKPPFSHIFPDLWQFLTLEVNCSVSFSVSDRRTGKCRQERIFKHISNALDRYNSCHLCKVLKGKGL